MSGVVLSPVLACRSRLDSDYCSCPLELDGYPYDLMLEYVGDWCLALTFHAGGQNYVSGSSDSNSFAFEYWTCVISVCNVHNCVRHSTLVERTL